MTFRASIFLMQNLTFHPTYLSFNGAGQGRAGGRAQEKCRIAKNSHSERSEESMWG